MDQPNGIPKIFFCQDAGKQRKELQHQLQQQQGALQKQQGELQQQLKALASTRGLINGWWGNPAQVGN